MDSGNDVYVTGKSYAEWGSPIDPHPGSHYDPFVARLSGATGGRRWNTFLGFSNISCGRDVAVGPVGGVYIVGESKARTGTFYDAYLIRLDRDGSWDWDLLVARTSAHDYAKGIVVSSGGDRLFVAGDSNASWGLPIVAFADGTDAFAAGIAIPTIFEDGFETGTTSGWSSVTP